MAVHMPSWMRGYLLDQRLLNKAGTFISAYAFTQMDKALAPSSVTHNKQQTNKYAFTVSNPRRHQRYDSVTLLTAYSVS